MLVSVSRWQPHSGRQGWDAAHVCHRRRAHAEPQEGQFRTREQAFAELERRAAIPWNEPPNRAPCTNSLNCGRRYELVEYDDSAPTWKELTRTLTLEISAAGVRWHSAGKTVEAAKSRYSPTSRSKAVHAVAGFLGCIHKDILDLPQYETTYRCIVRTAPLA